MTPDEAADVADRTLAAIDADADELRPGDSEARAARWKADRERIASDLAGLRDHAEACDSCAIGYDCPDAARYAGGLRRTADLHGVSA